MQLLDRGSLIHGVIKVLRYYFLVLLLLPLKMNHMMFVLHSSTIQLKFPSHDFILFWNTQHELTLYHVILRYVNKSKQQILQKSTFLAIFSICVTWSFIFIIYFILMLYAPLYIYIYITCLLFLLYISFFILFDFRFVW